jgi:hypothetical protein
MKPNNFIVDNNKSDVNKMEIKFKQIWSMPRQNKSQLMSMRWQNRNGQELISCTSNVQNYNWIQDVTGRRLANSGAMTRTSVCIRTEQTHAQVANTLSARHEIHLSRNPKIHYLVYKRLLPEPATKQVCPVHTLTRISLRSILISSSHVCSGVQMVSFL